MTKVFSKVSADVLAFFCLFLVGAHSYLRKTQKIAKKRYLLHLQSLSPSTSKTRTRLGHQIYFFVLFSLVIVCSAIISESFSLM